MKNTSRKEIWGVFFGVFIPYLVISATDWAYFESDGWLIQATDLINNLLMLDPAFLPIWEASTAVFIPFPISVFIIAFSFVFNGLNTFESMFIRFKKS